MKAIVINDFGGLEVLNYEDIEKPNIKPNEVLIAVEATSVNFADILTREGKYHAAGKPPLIPGIDVAGVIASVGSNVKNIRVGQKVVAFPKTGSYAEYCVADQHLVYAIPDSVNFEQAAASPTVVFTSYNLLANVARLASGESVLIHGASGGIGTTAIQIAKILGAGRVIGTVSKREKAEIALDSGADEVIINEEEDFIEKVNELSGGKGVDIILDSISGSVTERGLACLAPFGRLVVFGNSSGEKAEFNNLDLHSSCRSVLGFSIGTAKKLKPQILNDTAEKVFEYMSEGLLTIPISATFKLQDAAEAHRLIESRKNTGKILLTVK